MSTAPRIRLYMPHPLSQGEMVACDEKRSHYLCNVLRQKEGDTLALFNGKDGEWLASIDTAHKKHTQLKVVSRLREQQTSPDLWLVAAPLKQGRTDGVVEKATELGISRFLPVMTRFSSVDRCNIERLSAIAIEAAEQCERMDVPQIEAAVTLEKLLGSWPQERTLLYADETGGGNWPLTLPPSQPLAVLVGPEGGFAQQELALLRTLPFARAITLGPRILRADTAAIASITLIQSLTGDWAKKPDFRSQEHK